MVFNRISIDFRWDSGEIHRGFTVDSREIYGEIRMGIHWIFAGDPRAVPGNQLGMSWELPGSVRALGISRVPCGTSWGRVGTGSFLGASQERPGSRLGASWELLGTAWGLGRSSEHPWEYHGSPLGASGSSLELPTGLLEAP